MTSGREPTSTRQACTDRETHDVKVRQRHRPGRSHAAWSLGLLDKEILQTPMSQAAWVQVSGCPLEAMALSCGQDLRGSGDNFDFSRVDTGAHDRFPGLLKAKKLN